jgi:serine/threonine-protein kinase SRPK3
MSIPWNITRSSRSIGTWIRVTREHSGREFVRGLEDSFKLKSRHGEHDVLVMTPLDMSLRTLQEMQKTGIFQQNLVVSALNQVLVGLNFLHEADVIHTGKYIPHPPHSCTNGTFLSN